MRRRGEASEGEEAEGSSGLRDGRLGEERGSSRPLRRPLHGNHASQGRAKRFARHALQQADAAGERRAPSGHLARAARAAFARPRGGRVEVCSVKEACHARPPLPCCRTRALAVRKGRKGLSALPLHWPPLRPLLDRRRCREHAGTLALRPPARPELGQRRGRQVVRRRHGRARRSRRSHPPKLWVRVSERDLGRGALVSERAPARTGAENATRAGPAQLRAKPQDVCSR